MKTGKQALLLMLSALIGAGVGSYASINKSQRHSSVACLNAMLYDLNIEMDLLEHWNSKHKDDAVLEEKIKHLILNKMIAMSSTKHSIDDLQGVPLEAINRLLNYSKDNDLAIKKYESAFKPALTYLSSIEQDVNSIIEKRKDVHKRAFK